MKSLATITKNDIDTIKIALNDSVSDINNELKQEVKGKKRVELLQNLIQLIRINFQNY